MEPVSTAIIAAVVAGVTDISRSAIVDAYEGLKKLIIAKLGKTSEVAAAIDGVEKRPQSESRQTTLREEIALTNIARDETILAASEQLLTLLEQLPTRRPIESAVQIANGKNIAQANNGGKASVKVG